MPTPRPIIDTSSGVTVLMSVRPARMKRSRNAVATATSANTIGMKAATKVRNRIKRTMIATRMPIASWMPCLSGGNSASPLNSAVIPAAATVLRTESSTATIASRSLS